MEIASLSDAEFKALVIRLLRKIIECSHKIKEEVMATQSAIKQNIQGTYSEEKEAGIQINDLEKERNKQSTGTERRNKNSRK